jgi:endo-1,4-beta-xylanase
MFDNSNYLQLVRQAQLGDGVSLNLLSQRVRAELCTYIYRITLDFDLTEDLSQETLMEMVRAIKSLKDSRRFKLWLQRIASTKIKKHYRICGNKRIMDKTVFDADKLLQHAERKPDALGQLLKKELSQAIIKAMRRLKYNYRNILVLRCFEQMPYSDIAYTMGCSSIKAQLLFFRAKHSLKKELQSSGYKKEHLLASLGIFAGVTAMPFKSASASTAAVAPSAMKVGALASIIGAATTKVGIVTTVIATTALLTVSVPTALNNHGKSHNTLKDAFKKDFLIGAAVSSEQISGEDTTAISIIESQFNSITAENCLKWDSVHPRPDEYDFEQADRFVAFGEKNKMFIIGHTFIGQQQIPDWVFQDSEGNEVDRDTLLSRMREHILTVVGRYKGRVNAWQVVNEAIGSDGRMRNNKWLEIIGNDYVRKAFEYAHEADPDAELYYNEYDTLTSKATDSIARLVSDIKSRGGRIDGIGMEAHWELDYPPLNEIEAGITNLAKSGVKVMITEMDITVLPGVAQKQKKFNPYPDALPTVMQQKLAKRYGELFGIFCRHADTISSVTFWGVHDGQSWLNDWPIQGRTDYPLLFDRQYRPKPAFFAVLKAAKGK